MTSVPTAVDPPDLLPRVPYHDPSLPLVLLWSEKSGCTTLLKWFLHHIGKLEEATAHSDWIHDWEYDVMKADPAYDQRVAAALSAGTRAVKLVRDPFERAVSSYLMMCVLGDDSGHFTVDLRRQLRGDLYGDPDVPYGFGFVDLLRWMTTQDLTTINGHLGPQSTALEDRLPELEIVRLDEFDRRFRDIERELGLEPADLGRVTSSSHHTVRADPQPARAGAIARLHLPIPHGDTWPLPPASAFLDAETAELVRTLFAEDYARYGFDPPAPTGPSRRSDQLMRALRQRMSNVVARSR